ncbi:hypothetical protein RRG08_044286 [Elysia crispata]|uniref:Uncharacterized protein n=1 Tax=Elysia crispata TaxID=231223 RepID=A0AAE1CPE0_9GAST|nr:hypothetical protein RRG08_044286 [Elysia crispata]
MSPFSACVPHLAETEVPVPPLFSQMAAVSLDSLSPRLPQIPLFIVWFGLPAPMRTHALTQIWCEWERAFSSKMRF